MGSRTQKLLITTTLLAVIGFVPTGRAQFESLRRLTGGDEAPPKKQIAHFRIKGALVETPSRMPPLFGKDAPTSMESLLSRLKKARQDPSVVGVVFDLQQAQLGAAQIEELHSALRKFQAVDKDVYVHADSLTMGTYAAATSATHISMVPTGDLWLRGIYGETPYLRGMLDKIGVQPDFEQFEDYKSAAEPLMRTGPSEPAQEMTDWLIDSLFGTIVDLMAEGRGLSPTKIRDLIDHGHFSAEEALAAGLIDSVKHRQDFVSDLKSRYGKDIEVAMDYGREDEFELPSDNFFALFDFMMKLFNPASKKYSGPTVGVVYVDGPIMTGEAEPSPFGGSSNGAFSTTTRKALDEAADEPAVKAVVLRVDSPGGSALASEIILDAAMRVAKKKPLIVSMGNVAGSGGYYVSCRADTIFADRATITASIGVIGGKIVTTGMWDKLGVNWHANQRGAMAAMMSTASKFSDRERAKIREYMGSVYETFKAHVVAGRKGKLAKPIEKLAGGRVYTGAQAKELGLIDEIGGLDDAVKFAAKKAGLVDYDIRVIPEPPSIFDMLMGETEDDEFAMFGTAMSGSWLDLPLVRAALPTLFHVDPLRAKAVVQALRRLELIHREGVITMMPLDLVIH